MFTLIVSLFIAYILGSIPTSLILGRLFSGLDIRKMGSGNVGATNVYRVAGKLPGVLTLLFDIIKGSIAVSLLADYFYKWGIPFTFYHYQLLMGLAVIAGHDWTLFLKFKGGKGIATSAGVLLIVCPKLLGIVAVVWVIAFIRIKIVSFASIVASMALPIGTVFFGDFYLTLFAVILGLISVFKHRLNIKRLIRGEEKVLKL